MSASLADFLERARTAGLDVPAPDTEALAPALTLALPHTQWAAAARAAATAGLRWCALWAQEHEAGFEVLTCLNAGNTYVVLRTLVPGDEPLASMAPFFAAADRPERHTRDLLGICFDNQPDNRRWVRHAAWEEGEFPLRAEFDAERPVTRATDPDWRYPFVEPHGPGVVQIPVGPVHAGIIEPGHFRFLAVGETVLNLEERLGYVHKGIEKIAVGRDADGLARLAGRVSGDSTVAHAWAACQAMERAAGLDIPPRALSLRAVMAERERVANHLGDIGAICNDVGFAFAQVQMTRLKELWVRESASAFGHRFMMDCIVPGGAAADLSAEAARRMGVACAALAEEVARIIDMLERSESLEDRLMTTGRLAPDTATMLGVVGYVGRASGLDFDVRRDVPYAPYDAMRVAVPTYRAGDVAARARVRADEIGISLDLLGELLDSLPDGAARVAWPGVERACEGIGFVDGWRGEIITYVRFDERGRGARFFPRDPSWLTWPALELLQQGNIVPDFPVCNKSVNGSYSGHDL